MLSELRITNLGVIEEAELELHPGLTVISGETGAGKTMLVSSLQLVTGARADSSKVRNTAGTALSPDKPAEARVDGRFDLRGMPPAIVKGLSRQLDECGGVADDDGSVVVARTLRSDGRSRAFLGGRTVPAASLAEFTEPVLTIHGQHDQIRLLHPSQQRAAVDSFGGESVSALLTTYQTLWKQWRETTQLLRTLHTEGAQRQREINELTVALEEINQVAPEPHEDYQLQEDIRRLMDVDELREVASSARFSVSGDSQYRSISDSEARQEEPVTCTIDTLSEARSVLDNSSDVSLRELGSQLTEALAIVEDVSSELGEFLDQLDVDPTVLEQKLVRQAQLKNLTLKYGVDVDDVRAWAVGAADKLMELSHADTTIDSVREHVATLTVEVLEVARQLTSARKDAAQELQKRATTELQELAMKGTSLVISVDPDPSGNLVGGQLHLNEWGADQVTIRLRTSTGGMALPIAKAASGGELSRVMLALETVVAKDDRGRTLIFDEVDSGIGGSTALAVGRCLATLAQLHQVLVVTHLPQVAAFADNHVVVHKSADSGEPVTEVRYLTEDERIAELARMLAGLGETESGRAHARDLRERANAIKNRMDTP